MALSLRLANRVAVVTGGASGIGRAIVQRLSREGGKVVIADIDTDAGERTASDVRAEGGAAMFVHTDTSCEESIENCMQTAVQEYGSLNILVNNAVQFVFGHLGGAGTGSRTGTDKDITNEDWERVLTVNVLGYARAIKHAVPHMRRGDATSHSFDNRNGVDDGSVIDAGSRGSIVNVASVSSFIAQPEFVPYNCSKGAILQLTKCTAMDLAGDRIRVNAVCPGTVETRGSHGHMKLIGLSLDEGRKAFADSCLMKRQASPEEIANGVFFLASDEASFMTGASIVMDGGGTI